MCGDSQLVLRRPFSMRQIVACSGGSVAFWRLPLCLNHRAPSHISNTSSELSWVSLRSSAVPPFCFTNFKLCKIALVFLRPARSSELTAYCVNYIPLRFHRRSPKISYIYTFLEHLYRRGWPKVCITKHMTLFQITNHDNFLIILHLNNVICGPGSSVGIATGYGLDSPGIESRLVRDFPHLSDRPWGPNRLLYKGYRVFPGVESGRGVMMTPQPLLVPRSKNRVFVACRKGETCLTTLFRHYALFCLLSTSLSYRAHLSPRPLFPTTLFDLFLLL
jgi:hypothetical protein